MNRTRVFAVVQGHGHTHASAFSDGSAYERALGPAHRYYVRVKARALLATIRRHTPGARRLVDLGCGTGQMEESLAGENLELVGVDLAAPMIEHARSKNLQRTSFAAADAAHTGLPSGSFDAAFATALFHHVPPEARHDIVREMARLVRPSGLLIVFEHNPRNPITRRMVRCTPIDADASLVERREFLDLFGQAGLELVEQRYLVFFPRALGVFSLAEPFLGWCPAGGQYMVAARKPGKARGGNSRR